MTGQSYLLMLAWTSAADWDEHYWKWTDLEFSSWWWSGKTDCDQSTLWHWCEPVQQPVPGCLVTSTGSVSCGHNGPGPDTGWHGVRLSFMISSFHVDMWSTTMVQDFSLIISPNFSSILCTEIIEDTYFHINEIAKNSKAHNIGVLWMDWPQVIWVLLCSMRNSSFHLILMLATTSTLFLFTSLIVEMWWFVLPKPIVQGQAVTMWHCVTILTTSPHHHLHLMDLDQSPSTPSVHHQLQCPY